MSLFKSTSRVCNSLCSLHGNLFDENVCGIAVAFIARRQQCRCLQRSLLSEVTRLVYLRDIPPLQAPFKAIQALISSERTDKDPIQSLKMCCSLTSY